MRLQRVFHASECEYCGDEDCSDYYGTTLCESCIDFELNVDIDQHEADKRERISESQEY